MFGAINLKKLAVNILIPLAVGLLSWFFTKNNMSIYDHIKVPPLAPPKIVFPIVWSILYILMGISSYIVSAFKGDLFVKKRGYAFYAAQLFFNFMWTILFFNLKAFAFSSVWLVILTVLIGLNIVCFGKINVKSAYLLIPYIVWCVFALYLNIGTAALN